MDALSKIFDDIHLNKSEYIYLKPQGDWAYAYQEQDAMIGYVVLVGNLTIQLDSHTQLHVEAGDLVLIPSGQNHSCHNNNKNNLVEALNITALFDQKRQETIEFGSASGEPALILAIRGHIDTIMARPLLNALPSYIHFLSDALRLLRTGGILISDNVLQDGDIIEIDIPGRAINVKLTDEELAARPITPVTRQREVSKSLKAYASMVSSADKGAVRLID